MSDDDHTHNLGSKDTTHTHDLGQDQKRSNKKGSKFIDTKHRKNISECGHDA